MAKIKDTPKPGNDVYTGLLALSLVAMIIGCVLLALDLNSYETRTPPPLPRLEVPGAVKTTAAPATPRAETKEKEAPPAEAPKDAPKEDKKDGTRRLPPPSEPGLPKMIPAAAPKPEPAPLPKTTEDLRFDPNLKPAVAYEPVLEVKPVPAAKPNAPHGDDPPVLVKPFVPN